jgi:DNA replication and repair protein RecF
MYLESLWVQGFRALTELRIDITAPVTAVEGGNGAGKTTLLDAVYFLASGKSCLGLTNAELIRDGDPYFVIGGRYRSRDPVAAGLLNHTVQSMFTTEGRRELQIDGAVYHGFIRLIGGLRVVQFNFGSLFLVKGMPSIRRQFINLLIASCDHGYLEALSAYSAVMTRKNALLRQSGSGVVDASLLDLFDEQIATLTTTIYAKRRSVLAVVGQAMTRLIADGSFGLLSEVSILYDPRPISIESIRAIRDRELARHACLTGCHLDDFVLLRGKRQLRDTASLGEAKLMALLLTFAGAEYVRSVTGEYPVLLLDDLEGDLDMPNLDRLIHLLARFEQVLITSFDVAHLGGGLNFMSVRL